MKEIEDLWRYSKFTVMKFVKGTVDRGYILGGVDDIMATLDEHIMNLQGISASRFVEPFKNSVYELEKDLSHMSEVIEVLCLITVLLKLSGPMP